MVSVNPSSTSESRGGSEALSKVHSLSEFSAPCAMTQAPLVHPNTDSTQQRASLESNWDDVGSSGENSLIDSGGQDVSVHAPAAGLSHDGEGLELSREHAVPRGGSQHAQHGGGGPAAKRISPRVPKAGRDVARVRGPQERHSGDGGLLDAFVRRRSSEERQRGPCRRSFSTGDMAAPPTDLARKIAAIQDRVAAMSDAELLDPSKTHKLRMLALGMDEDEAPEGESTYSTSGADHAGMWVGDQPQWELGVANEGHVAMPHQGFLDTVMSSATGGLLDDHGHQMMTRSGNFSVASAGQPCVMSPMGSGSKRPPGPQAHGMLPRAPSNFMQRLLHGNASHGGGFMEHMVELQALQAMPAPPLPGPITPAERVYSTSLLYAAGVPSARQQPQQQPQQQRQQQQQQHAHHLQTGLLYVRDASADTFAHYSMDDTSSMSTGEHRGDVGQGQGQPSEALGSWRVPDKAPNAPLGDGSALASPGKLGFPGLNGSVGGQRQASRGVGLQGSLDSSPARQSQRPGRQLQQLPSTPGDLPGSLPQGKAPVLSGQQAGQQAGGLLPADSGALAFPAAPPAGPLTMSKAALDSRPKFSITAALGRFTEAHQAPGSSPLGSAALEHAPAAPRPTSTLTMPDTVLPPPTHTHTFTPDAAATASGDKQQQALGWPSRQGPLPAAQPSPSNRRLIVPQGQAQDPTSGDSLEETFSSGAIPGSSVTNNTATAMRQLAADETFGSGLNVSATAQVRVTAAQRQPTVLSRGRTTRRQSLGQEQTDEIRDFVQRAWSEVQQGHSSSPQPTLQSRLSPQPQRTPSNGNLMNRLDAKENPTKRESNLLRVYALSAAAAAARPISPMAAAMASPRSETHLHSGDSLQLPFGPHASHALRAPYHSLLSSGGVAGHASFPAQGLPGDGSMLDSHASKGYSVPADGLSHVSALLSSLGALGIDTSSPVAVDRVLSLVSSLPRTPIDTGGNSWVMQTAQGSGCGVASQGYMDAMRQDSGGSSRQANAPGGMQLNGLDRATTDSSDNVATPFTPSHSQGLGQGFTRMSEGCGGMGSPRDKGTHHQVRSSGLVPNHTLRSPGPKMQPWQRPTDDSGVAWEVDGDGGALLDDSLIPLAVPDISGNLVAVPRTVHAPQLIPPIPSILGMSEGFETTQGLQAQRQGEVTRRFMANHGSSSSPQTPARVQQAAAMPAIESRRSTDCFLPTQEGSGTGDGLGGAPRWPPPGCIGEGVQVLRRDGNKWMVSQEGPNHGPDNSPGPSPDHNHSRYSHGSSYGANPSFNATPIWVVPPGLASGTHYKPLEIALVILGVLTLLLNTVAMLFMTIQHTKAVPK